MTLWKQRKEYQKLGSNIWKDPETEKNYILSFYKKTKGNLTKVDLYGLTARNFKPIKKLSLNGDTINPENFINPENWIIDPKNRKLDYNSQEVDRVQRIYIVAPFISVIFNFIKRTGSISKSEFFIGEESTEESAIKYTQKKKLEKDLFFLFIIILKLIVIELMFTHLNQTAVGNLLY